MNKFNIALLGGFNFRPINNYIYHGFFYKNRKINYISYGFELRKILRNEL